ncbi:MAG: hypothetical protein F9Y92_06050 [Thermoplasmatales archaeon]|nr:hypothetical protein [Thermoplasmatales archaeon]
MAEVELVKDADALADAVMRLTQGRAEVRAEGGSAVIHTDARLPAGLVMALHKRVHEYGYFRDVYDCRICPFDYSTTAYGTLVVVQPAEPVCPLQCPYCYAKPTPSGRMPVPDPRKLARYVYSHFIAPLRGGNAVVNVVPWGGSSDPTLLPTSYFTNFIDELGELVAEGVEESVEVNVNLSTSGETAKVQALVDAVADMLEEYSGLRMKSHIAVTAHPATFPGGHRMSAAERYELKPSYEYSSVFIYPVFIVHKHISDAAGEVIGLADRLGTKPIILAPYYTSERELSYFGFRSAREIKEELRSLVYKVLTVERMVYLDTCSYNALFGGIRTPEFYRGRYAVVKTDGRSVHAEYHDGTWCPRGVYSGHGCIYPPRQFT